MEGPCKMEPTDGTTYISNHIQTIYHLVDQLEVKTDKVIDCINIKP